MSAGKDRNRRERDRALLDRDKERDREVREEENERSVEKERRGAQLREAWRQRHPQREQPKKIGPPAGGAA